MRRRWLKKVTSLPIGDALIPRRPGLGEMNDDGFVDEPRGGRPAAPRRPNSTAAEHLCDILKRASGDLSIEI